MKECDSLLKESTARRENCVWCNETDLVVGQKTKYGAVVVYKIGDDKNGWFATLSPKTGGLEKDFTLQLMPSAHLTHFSQIDASSERAKNFGIAFARLARSMTAIITEEDNLEAVSETREKSVSIATYGKCTTWKEKKEHLHMKIFPFRGNIGQPYTVDSTFEKKVVHKDPITNEEFVKMAPVKKKMIEEKRFAHLSRRLTKLLQ